MGRYRLFTTSEFDRSLKKLSKKDKNSAEKVVKVLEMLMRDPFYKGLKTHKVLSRSWGEVYSSRVTGDIRVIWDFVEIDSNQKVPVIGALSVGGHDYVY